MFSFINAGVINFLPFYCSWLIKQKRWNSKKNALIKIIFYCGVESLPRSVPRGVGFEGAGIVPAPNASMLTITGMSCTSGTLGAEKGLNGDGHAPAKRAFCTLFAHLVRNCVQLLVFAPVSSAGHFSLSLFRVFLAFRVAPRAALASHREKEREPLGVLIGAASIRQRRIVGPAPWPTTPLLFWLTHVAGSASERARASRPPAN